MSYSRGSLFTARLVLIGSLVVGDQSILASPFEYPGELSPSASPLQGSFSPDRFPTLTVAHEIEGSGQFEGTPFTFTPNSSLHPSLSLLTAGETGALGGSLTVGLRNERSNNFGVDYKVFDEWNDFEVEIPSNVLIGQYPNVPFPIEIDFNGAPVSSEFLYSFVVRGFRIVQAGTAIFNPLPFLPSVDVPIYFQIEMPVALQATVDVWVDLADYDLAAPIKIVEDGTLAGLATMRGTVLGPFVTPFPSVISFPPISDTRYFDLDHMETLDISVLTGSFNPSWAVNPGDVVGENLTFAATTDLQIALSLDPFDFDMDGTYVIPEASSMFMACFVAAAIFRSIHVKRRASM